MAHIRMNLVLTGPLRNRTISLRGYRFENGVCSLQGPSEVVHGAATYLGRVYQAFPEGSDELQAAQVRDGDVKEAADGGVQAQPTAEQDADDQVPSDVQSQEQPTVGPSAEHGQGPAPSEAGEPEQPGTAGDGHGSVKSKKRRGK